MNKHSPLDLPIEQIFALEPWNEVCEALQQSHASFGQNKLSWCPFCHKQNESHPDVIKYGKQVAFKMPSNLIQEVQRMMAGAQNTTDAGPSLQAAGGVDAAMAAKIQDVLNAAQAAPSSSNQVPSFMLEQYANAALSKRSDKKKALQQPHAGEKAMQVSGGKKNALPRSPAGTKDTKSNIKVSYHLTVKSQDVELVGPDKRGNYERVLGEITPLDTGEGGFFESSFQAAYLIDSELELIDFVLSRTDKHAAAAYIKAPNQYISHHFYNIRNNDEDDMIPISNASLRGPMSEKLLAFRVNKEGRTAFNIMIEQRSVSDSPAGKQYMQPRLNLPLLKKDLALESSVKASSSKLLNAGLLRLPSLSPGAESAFDVESTPVPIKKESGTVRFKIPAFATAGSIDAIDLTGDSPGEVKPTIDPSDIFQFDDDLAVQAEIEEQALYAAELDKIDADLAETEAQDAAKLAVVAAVPRIKKEPSKGKKRGRADTVSESKTSSNKPRRSDRRPQPRSKDR